VNLPSFIDTNENLKELCTFLSQYDAIAVDTEFVWMRTYYPQLGIIQLGVSPEHSYIIDNVAVTDCSPLRELMENESIVKIFHDAHQDITIINRYIDGTVTNVFDTQRCAGFTGRSRSLSLEKLILNITGIQLEKSETRTNWLKRPLDPKQVEYALDDVRYLPEVRTTLLDDAEKLGNKEFLLDEMKINDGVIPFDFMEAVERQFKKIGGRVPGRFRSAAYRLVIWQETSARRRDIPREHVLKKEILVKIASTEINSVEDLEASGILTVKQLSKFGSELLDALNGTEEPSKEVLQQMRRPQSDSNEMASLISVYQSFIHSVARNRGIDPQLLFNKSQVSSLVRSYCKKKAIKTIPGWRGELVESISNQFFSGNLHMNVEELPEQE
jgi:ribonuclease D